MATIIVRVPDMISKTGTTRKSWEAKVKRCRRKIPMAIDPEATVMAPNAINRILVISRRRDRPELPLMVFILCCKIPNVTSNTETSEFVVRIVLTQRKLVWLSNLQFTLSSLMGFLCFSNASWRLCAAGIKSVFIQSNLTLLPHWKMHIFQQRKWKFCAKLKGRKKNEWAKRTSDFNFTRDY